jgi:hypothetical protein
MRHGLEVFTMVHFKQMFHSIKVPKIFVKEYGQRYTTYVCTCNIWLSNLIFYVHFQGTQLNNCGGYGTF